VPCSGKASTAIPSLPTSSPGSSAASTPYPKPRSSAPAISCRRCDAKPRRFCGDVTVELRGFPILRRSRVTARASQTITEAVLAGHPHIDRRVQVIAGAVEIVCDDEVSIAANNERFPTGCADGWYLLEGNSAALAAANA